jgi:hypothetical protein
MRENHNMSNIQISKIISKEMNRKEFLKYSSGILLAVIGVTGFLNTLLKLDDNSSKENNAQTGYSSSTYGR